MSLVGRLRSSLSPISMDDDELLDLANAVESRPNPAIRVRPGVDWRELPFDCQPVAWHSRTFTIPAGSVPGSRIEYGAGDYYIQDSGSVLAITLLDVQPGELVCDLCASPGGKSTAVLESIGEAGWLLANEAVATRLSPLILNLARHGSTQFAVSQLDPDDLARRAGSVFDAVLVDAPCSGQSLIGRGKQTHAAFSESTIEHCSARQSRILDAATRLVRPGGRLIYATCTFAYLENEYQIQRLLNACPDSRIEPCESLSTWESTILPGCYRLWPHRHGCGGAFAACVRVGESREPTSGRASRKARLRRKDLPADTKDWGVIDVASYGSENQCFGWASEPPATLLDSAVAGPEVAFRKAKTWFPAYALARRAGSSWAPRARVELDDTEAQQYLQGNVVPRAQAGWAVACWHHRTLGWLKGDGRRMKNHLPKPARIQIRSNAQ